MDAAEPERKEITWEPRRLQISMHEDRYGDLHVRIEQQPDDKMTQAVLRRESKKSFAVAMGIVGLLIEKLEKS